MVSPCFDESSLLRPSILCNRVTKLDDVVRILCFGLVTDFFLPIIPGGGGANGADGFEEEGAGGCCALESS